MALDADALVSVSVARRLGQPMHFELLNFVTIDPRQRTGSLGTIHEFTQWYISRLEELIRLAPDQYWWLHRRWKDSRRRSADKRWAA
jgi:KDO2-lipid IV(A) lauroyltransferase